MSVRGALVILTKCPWLVSPSKSLLFARSMVTCWAKHRSERCAGFHRLMRIDPPPLRAHEKATNEPVMTSVRIASLV